MISRLVLNTYLGVVSHKRQPNKIDSEANICVLKRLCDSDMSASSNFPDNKARPLAVVTIFPTPSLSGRPKLSSRQRTKVSERTATSCSVARYHLTRASTTRPEIKTIRVIEIPLPNHGRNNRNITGSVILANGYTVLCDRKTNNYVCSIQISN